MGERTRSARSLRTHRAARQRPGPGANPETAGLGPAARVRRSVHRHGSWPGPRPLPRPRILEARARGDGPRTRLVRAAAARATQPGAAPLAPDDLHGGAAA